MQILIEIPEDVIECAKSSPNYYPTYHFEKIWRAIVNGVLLPKGHGRIIDADAFAIRGEYLEKLYGSDFYWEFKKQLDKAPTIIEADKEDKE